MSAELPRKYPPVAWRRLVSLCAAAGICGEVFSFAGSCVKNVNTLCANDVDNGRLMWYNLREPIPFAGVSYVGGKE